MEHSIFDHLNSPRKHKVVTEKPKRNYKESNEQGTVAGYLKRVHPDLVFHTSTTEGAKTFGAQQRLVKQNSEPGYPDTTIFLPNGKVLLIEQKPLNTNLTLKDGTTLASDHLQHQYKCHCRLWKLGHTAFFAIGVSNAIEIIESCLKGLILPRQVFALRVSKTEQQADEFFNDLKL